MLLTDKLKSIIMDAKSIRESLQVQDPRSANFNPAFGDKSYWPVTGASRMAKVAEVAKLFHEVYKGIRPEWHLKEAMSTSDFPLLFGDLMYRQMLGNYAVLPPTYSDYFKVMELRDFRPQRLLTLDGGQGQLAAVAERAPYPETKFVEGEYTISVAKYGRRYGISFEMVINDDLNAFQERPMLMAQSAAYSEELLATSMLVDVNGPHASFFTSGNNNIITGNPVLSVPALKTAFTQIWNQRDVDGRAIRAASYQLVITQNDEVTAREIMNATQVWLGGLGGLMTDVVVTSNWIPSLFTLSVNPYLLTVASNLTSNPWFLVAKPAAAVRPAFMFAFLRGRTSPQLFVRDPNQVNLGGGDADIMEGNFENDSIDYKLRHIFGAAQGDPKMAVASDGSGS